MEDGSPMPLWGLFLLLLLVVLNGIFYGFAEAVNNLSENEIEKKASEGNKQAIRLKIILEKSVQYVHVIPIIMIASGICAGTFLVPAFVHSLLPYIRSVPAFLFAALICVVLFASFGILTFQRIGTHHPEGFALKVANLIYAVISVLYPLTALVTVLSKLAAVPFGIPFDSVPEAVTEEEIISIVDEAHEQGVIEENEAEMIQNIISFNETDASEIMTHRMNVIAFAAEDHLSHVTEVMMDEGRSRYPVYGKDLDDIIGIINYKDAMSYLTRHKGKKEVPIGEIRELIRVPAFIPETRSIGDLFRTMQLKKLHMAVVVDEYGQTAGIITMEDILEEIVGEIQDEYDEEEILIKEQRDSSLIIQGLTSMEDVQEELDTDFGDLEFETLNGYLTSLLGHIPTTKDVNTELIAKGYRFTILSLGNRTIDRVRAEKIKEKNKKGEEEVCQDIQNSQI